MPPRATPRRGAGVGWIPQRPALLAAVALIIGICLHAALPHAPLLWCIVAVGCALAAAVSHHWGRIASACLFTGITSAGAAVAQVEAFYYPASHIGAYATDTPRLAQLELEIDHEPRVLTDPFGTHPMPPRQVVNARVVRVLTWSGWRDSCGEILVQIAQPNPRLALGQRVRALGQLDRPAPAMNPGQFDWATYYREQRVLASMHIPLATNVTILSQGAIGPIEYLRRGARDALAAGFAPEQSLDHALLRALLLGDHDPEMRDVQEQFRRTGTSHHLTVSGMHVAVLSAFVYGLCCALRLRPRTSALVTLGFAVLYGAVALPASPIARSILLTAFITLGVLSRRSIDPIQLLGIVVLAMLIYHPADLYNAGFQLGFGIVLGLMLFTRPLWEWFCRACGRDLDRFFDPRRPPTLLQRAGSWCESKLTGAFIAGIVAWIVSMPLVAFHFGQLNPWTIPASIILAPFVFASLVAGLFKVVLTLIFPGAATTWAVAAAMPVEAMRHVLDWLNRLPASDFPLPGLPVWGLLAAFALMLLLAKIPCPQPKLKLCLRGSPLAVCFAAALLPLHGVERAVAGEQVQFTLLAVGAGQCAVLETPSGRTMMIDAGSVSLSDLLSKCAAPYLRSRGCTHLDTLVLTHSDFDHISGAGAIAGVYDVREVLVGGRFRSHAAGNPPAETLLRTLDGLDLPPRVVSPGDRIPLGREVEIEVLWPPPSGRAPRDLSSNDSAVVARIHYAGRSILITGDIQDMAMKELLKQPGLLKSDVLIAPHHGSSETLTPAFVAAVDPQVILSSNDRTLTGKQRRFETMVGNRLLYRTNRCGAVTVRILKDGSIKVEPFLRPQ